MGYGEPLLWVPDLTSWIPNVGFNWDVPVNVSLGYHPNYNSSRRRRLWYHFCKPTCNVADALVACSCITPLLLPSIPEAGQTKKSSSPFWSRSPKGLAVLKGSPPSRLPQIGFIMPFEVDWRANPLAIHLKLPSSLNVCPNFHVSLLNPGSESKVVMPSVSLLPPCDWQ